MSELTIKGNRFQWRNRLGHGRWMHVRNLGTVINGSFVVAVVNGQTWVVSGDAFGWRVVSPITITLSAA